MIIRVTITNAQATKEGVTIQVRFLAVDGPYAGQFLDKEFFFVHPVSVDGEILPHLTSFANMLKVSLSAPYDLNGMEFDV